MSGTAVKQFRSSARRGYSDDISGNPRRVFARKRVQEIGVEFANAPCTVQSQEGVVHAQPGDAILTGTAGERWRVSRRLPGRCRERGLP